VGDVTDSDLIRNLLARYWIYLDDRREREWVDLFEDDPDLEFGDVVVRSRGELEALAATFRNYGGGKHISSNELLEVRGDDASATSDVVFLAPDTEGTVRVRYYGRCSDRLRRRRDEWRFTSRRISFQGGHHG
jgi:hypothetical protein